MKKKILKILYKLKIKNNVIFNFKYVYLLKYYNFDMYFKIRNSKY